MIVLGAVVIAADGWCISWSEYILRFLDYIAGMMDFFVVSLSLNLYELYGGCQKFSIKVCF